MALQKKIVEKISHQKQQNRITDLVLMSLLPTLSNLRPRHMFKI